MLLGASLLIAAFVIFVTKKWSMFSYFFCKREQPITKERKDEDDQPITDPKRISKTDSVNEKGVAESIQEVHLHTIAKTQAQSNGSITTQVPILNLELHPHLDDEDDLK